MAENRLISIFSEIHTYLFTQGAGEGGLPRKSYGDARHLAQGCKLHEIPDFVLT